MFMEHQSSMQNQNQCFQNSVTIKESLCQMKDPKCQSFFDSPANSVSRPRTRPLGHGHPFHIHRNGTGLLLSSSSSSSLSMQHHCDLSVLNSERDLFDFTVGRFSNLVTHLERKKNILQEAPCSFSKAAGGCLL